MAPNVEKTDEQWRAELTPEEYQVLRKAGTERAFTGEYTDTETTGVYRCKACQAKLFESDTKFHSGCGWPSFYQPISDTIDYIEDTSFGQKRVERKQQVQIQVTELSGGHAVTISPIDGRHRHFMVP